MQPNLAGSHDAKKLMFLSFMDFVHTFIIVTDFGLLYDKIIRGDVPGIFRDLLIACITHSIFKAIVRWVCSVYYFLTGMSKYIYFRYKRCHFWERLSLLIWTKLNN